ncbi:hypothetical protein ACFOVU_12610 [Nocardiopsis sediminis]|uniref:Nucleotidyl transferase AbiEii/AbiGii toxin family protein n=1 Tax=Nocardiopsis sediminis TaxID=1778267 RepID=A0ABV8FNY6_9ACTN
MTSPYATPAAFRRALTDRLRSAAQPHGPWPLAELQRQFAYDRLLARLYRLDSGWIVKGATALLARELAVRRTIDIDIYRSAGRDQAERDLRDAAAHDLGDWFRFEADRAAPVSEAGRRNLPLPPRFAVPDRELWERGFAAEARRALALPATTLREAHAVVGPFIDPLLDGTATGMWNPLTGAWESPGG